MFCFSFSDSVAGRESLPNRVLAICSTIPSKTEMMMAASRVSLNTMKKIGTENTFGMTASRTLQRKTSTPGGEVPETRGEEKRRASGKTVERLGAYQIKIIR